MKNLEFDKVKLELLISDDVQALYKSFKDDLIFKKNINPSYFEVPNISKDTWNDEYYGIKYNNEYVGYIDLYISRWCRAGTIIIGFHEQVRNTFIPVKAMAILVKYAFEHLGLRKLDSTVHEYNIPCKKILNKFFVLEGTLRKNIYVNCEYYDTLKYGLLLEEYLQLKDKYKKYFNRIGV